MRKKDLKNYVFPGFIARSGAIFNFEIQRKTLLQKMKDAFKKQGESNVKS